MILALDIGKGTGWAAGVRDDVTPPKLGTCEIPWPREVTIDGQRAGYDYGPSVEAFANVTLQLIADHKPTRLYLEAPYVPQRAMDEIFVRLVAGYMPLRVEEICRRARIPMSEVHVGTVRALFCRQIAKLTPQGKQLSNDERVNLACQARGWRPADTHQADAAALFAFARHELGRDNSR